MVSNFTKMPIYVPLMKLVMSLTVQYFVLDLFKKKKNLIFLFQPVIVCINSIQRICHVAFAHDNLHVFAPE